MYYSVVGILALTLHFILNHEVMKRKSDLSSASAPQYRQYLMVLAVYYLSDLMWGILNDAHMTFLAYADTVIYFLTMGLAVLLWTKYVIAYIDRKGKRSTSLLIGVWIYFIYVIGALIVNSFKPVLFMFDQSEDYVPGFARYAIFGMQVFLFIILAIYCFFVSIKKEGADRTHYRTVSASSAVLALFTALQVMYPLLPYFAIASLVSTSLIHVFVEEDEKIERERAIQSVLKKGEISSHIAESLAEDYDAIYYINIETGKYLEYSTSSMYDSMNVPKSCEDFYGETQANVRRYAHPDDRDFAVGLYNKESMLKHLEGRNSYTYKYRIMINGKPRYFSFTVILAKDKKHFVLVDKDIDDEITAETALLETHQRQVTYGQIAESIASNYDVIYYVDISDGNYIGFTSRNIFGQLEVNRSGNDFFADSRKKVAKILHPQDNDPVMGFLDKDYLISSLEDRKQIDIEYRLIVNDSIQHTRLTARITSDREHFIICVENIEDEVRREREHLKALNTEKELARRDELTGTKNKTAYSELEQSVQQNIDNGMDYLPFAIAVCDINDLKRVNDTKGHKAGDEYIKAAAKLLCDIFDHSPVFRIGGDEFVIFLRGSDYTEREELFTRLRETVLANMVDRNGPVIAAGMSEYRPETDHSMTEVFDRADNMMYENKRKLKGNSFL